MILPKEPWVAVTLSLMLPGLGHAYAGRARRGLGLFCIGAVAAIFIVAYALHPSTRISLPTVAAAAVFSIALALHVLIDAYRSAQAWNIQHDVPKSPRWRRVLLIVATLLPVFLFDPMEHLARYAARYVIENIAQAFVIPASSMEPTLKTGDRILVDKRIYRSRDLRRGDVIVFRYPINPNKHFVKRIVGLPGERIAMKDGLIQIDGRPLTEVYPTALPGGDRACSSTYGPTVVPKDSIFVLGDNRCNSEDSRFFGSVPLQSVLGKVTKIYYPFDRSGPVE